MTVVFLGSGPFAVPVLEMLHRLSGRYPLLLAITRPDRPAGRGRKLRPTPVRERARALGTPSIAVRSTREPATRERLRSLGADLYVVADYGEILDREVLALPAIGAFNLHASLLPRHRGAAPVAHAILAGDETTGVTLFRVAPDLDSGPVVARAEVRVGADETAGELEARLASLAARLLEEHMEAFAQGTFRETPQDPLGATRAPRLHKAQGAIDWSQPPERVSRLVRALNPWPRAYTYLHRSPGPGGAERSLRIGVLRAAAGSLETRGVPPGTVVEVGRDGFQVAAGGGSALVLECQREGKSPMSAGAFLRGLRLAKGDRFASSP